MDGMKTNRPPFVALFTALLTFLVAYLGSYATLVKRTKSPGILSVGQWEYSYVPTYRFSDGPAVRYFFAPVHELDYWLRPVYWDEEIKGE